jgi:tetratricopeptide (TPR) repeat protein
MGQGISVSEDHFLAALQDSDPGIESSLASNSTPDAVARSVRRYIVESVIRKHRATINGIGNWAKKTLSFVKVSETSACPIFCYDEFRLGSRFRTCKEPKNHKNCVESHNKELDAIASVLGGGAKMESLMKAPPETVLFPNLKRNGTEMNSMGGKKLSELMFPGIDPSVPGGGIAFFDELFVAHGHWAPVQRLLEGFVACAKSEGRHSVKPILVPEGIDYILGSLYSELNRRQYLDDNRSTCRKDDRLQFICDSAQKDADHAHERYLHWIGQSEDAVGQAVFALLDICQRTKLDSMTRELSESVPKDHPPGSPDTAIRQVRKEEDFLKEGAEQITSGKLDAAIESFQMCIRVKADSKRCWYNIGVVEGRRHRYEKEIDAYRNALEIDPKFEAAWYNLGVANMDNGSKDEALACFDKAIAANPKADDALSNRGNLLLAKGRIDDALASYRVATEVRPDSVQAWLGLGEAYDRKAEKSSAETCTEFYRLAVAAYRHAIELRPNDGRTYRKLGFTYGRLKEKDARIAAYEKSVQVAPDDVRGWYDLGMTLKDEGEKARAITALETYVRLAEKLPLEESWVTEARDLLKDLKREGPGKPRGL